MTSSEGEHVPFEKFMYIDGPVEVRSNLILMYIKSFQVRMFMSQHPFVNSEYELKSPYIYTKFTQFSVSHKMKLKIKGGQISITVNKSSKFILFLAIFHKTAHAQLFIGNGIYTLGKLQSLCSVGTKVCLSSNIHVYKTTVQTTVVHTLF